MTTEGKIVRIISDKSIIVNLGTSQGVEVGDEFKIAANVEEIIDPENGASYGYLSSQKDILEVTEVYPNFSVLSKIVRVREEGALSKAMASSNLYGKTTISHRQLNIDNSEIKEINIQNEDKIIHLGDTATLIK